jgi:[acyl-carrier-protein] S-malonyltransferase
MTYAVLFPGQGSQSVGMGADVFATRPDLLGVGTDAILGWPLAEIVAEGPEDELVRTDRAQPALYAIAYALWEALAGAVERPPAAAAGHSLGEYTALAAAGVFGFDTGLRVVAERGRAMADAAGLAASGMAALLGADVEVAEGIAADRRETGGRLWVANINAPTQVVVAGSEADIAWLVANARDLGVRRAVQLKVAGAFHTPYMDPAAKVLADVLDVVPMAAPEFPVYANVTAEPTVEPARELVAQLTAPVRFAESLQRMARDGVDTFVHVGPGDVTAGLARRCVPDAEVFTVSTLAEVPAAATHLSVQ